jgi:pimeloyl-ACP methyl ester carboxylesterase
MVAQVAKEVEVNGVRLQYIEQGSGEPIVFVHGAPHDLRAWQAVREVIAMTKEGATASRPTLMT